MNLCSIPHYHPATPTYARTARDTSYSRYTRRIKYRLIGISSIFRDRQTDMDLCETQATAEHYRVPRGTLLKLIWRRHHLYKKIRSILLEVPVWTHLTHKLHQSMCKINASHTNFSARLSIANFGSLRN